MSSFYIGCGLCVLILFFMMLDMFRIQWWRGKEEKSFVEALRGMPEADAHTFVLNMGIRCGFSDCVMDPSLTPDNAPDNYFELFEKDVTFYQTFCAGFAEGKANALSQLNTEEWHNE